MKIFAHIKNKNVIDFFAVEQDIAYDKEKKDWQEISDTTDENIIKEAFYNKWLGTYVKDESGHFNFKISYGKVVQRTDDEKSQDAPTVSVPTQLDKVEAQLAYTAMMTGTLLEE